MNIVHTRIIEAVNHGEDLAALLNDLFQNRSACHELIYPSLYSLTQCFQIARDRGQNVTQPNEAMNEFLTWSLERQMLELVKNINCNGPLASQQISAIVGAVNTARATGTTWHTPDQPPAAVQVVSLPARVTHTDIQRDPKTKQIVSSTQREADVA
jgi:hypothetical protein